MRFNSSEIRKIMPADSFYVSILRDPAEVFESTFHYYYYNVPSFRRGPKQDDPESVEIWLNNTNKYFNPQERSGLWFYAKNHAMFDFGYNAVFKNKDEIEKTIQEIDQIFDFILISNYMDESLVLLADMLCCPLAEVSSIVLNARAESEKQDKSRMKRISKKVREWNKADSALFDYFNKSLWNKIEKFGYQRMEHEVTKLQAINQNLMNQCSDGKKLHYNELKNAPWKNMHLYEPKEIKIVGYDLKAGAEQNETCVYLLGPEPFLNKVVNEKQKQRQPQAQEHANTVKASH